MFDKPVLMVAALLVATATSAHADRSPDALSRTRREDLEIARAAYVDKSRAFSTETRLRALRFIDRAEQRADAMSAEEFLLTVLQIPAFADNGHDVLNDNDDDGAWYPQARLPQVIVGTLRPDLPAPITIAAWLAGRDPGLEAVRRDLREHRLLTSPDSDFARFPKVKWRSPLVAGDRAR